MYPYVAEYYNAKTQHIRTTHFMAENATIAMLIADEVAEKPQTFEEGIVYMRLFTTINGYCEQLGETKEYKA